MSDFWSGSQYYDPRIDHRRITRRLLQCQYTLLAMHRREALDANNRYASGRV